MRPAFCAILFLVSLARPLRAADDLKPGDQLASNEGCVSADGFTKLVMQKDGNLVLYRRGIPLWNSETSGIGTAVLKMQEDGNMVVYQMQGVDHLAKWDSNTAGHAGAELKVHNEGYAAVWTDGRELWSTETQEAAASVDVAVGLSKILFGKKALDKAIEELKKEGNSRHRVPQLRLPPLKGATKAVPPSRLSQCLQVAKKAIRYVRIGGRLIPVISSVLLIADGAQLVYEGGSWLYDNYDRSQPPDDRLGHIEVNREQPEVWEAITPIAAGEEDVSLHFHTGFLCADPDTNKVIANRRSVGEWELFRVERHNDGTVSFFAVAAKKYLRLSTDETPTLVADAARVGPSERFRPEIRDERMYLLGSNGCFVSAQPRP